MKIFRKIRQKLLADKKLTNYLFYALGEITLVVIGILIAVQINTMANNSKLISNNEIFLGKMITELNLNKTRMNYLAFSAGSEQYRSLDRAVKNSDSLLKMTYRGLNQSDLSFILNERLTAGGSYLNLHNSIYRELISTGKLYSLGSDTLITAIKNYYNFCERENLYNRDNTEHMNEGMELINESVYKLKLDHKMDVKNFSLDNYPWFFDRTSNHYQNLQIGLDRIHSNQLNNLQKMELIISETEMLIKTIQNELTHQYD